MTVRILISLLLILLAFPAQQCAGQALQTRGKYLYSAPYTPFFWVGDANWMLMHGLAREGIVRYLDDRKARGFNIVQCSFLSNSGLPVMVNVYGDQPFAAGEAVQLDITPGRKPEEEEAYDYWDHIEWVLKQATDRELYVAVVPMWSSLVAGGLVKSPADAYNYGFQVGKRYALYNQGIVWLLGGDQTPGAVKEGPDIWHAMAEGITDGVKGEEGFDDEADFKSTTIAYSCRQSSLIWLNDQEWIDFHTWGTPPKEPVSSLAYTTARFEHLVEDLKPSVNAQSVIEGRPYPDFSAEAGASQTNAWQVRRSAYWSVFSGACGFTYGASPLGELYSPERIEKGDKSGDELTKALGLPGGNQMQFLSVLMRSRPFHSGNSAQELLASNPDDPEGYMAATMGEGYAFIYTPTGKTIHVEVSKLPFRQLRSWWFDPRIGIALEAAYTNEGPGFVRFDPPGEEKAGNDWVLVLDDVTLNFKPPGVLSD